MRYIVIALLFLSGCGKADFYNLFGVRMFKVGDCLVTGSEELEAWDKGKTPDYIVREIGKGRYRAEYVPAMIAWKNSGFASNPKYNEIKFGHLWEDFYQKVPCNGVE